MKKDPNSERFYLWLNQTPIDEHKQVYRDICKSYGLADSEIVEKLADFGFKVFIYHHVDQYNLPDLDDYQFWKDLATLTNIFKNGRRIKIKTTMPDGDYKEKPIKLDIETNGKLQQLAFLCFNTLIAQYERKDLVIGNGDPEALKYLSILIDYPSMKFKAPFSDKELADIIEDEAGKIAALKTMKGRTNKEIPMLGSMVHGFIEAGGDGLASLGTFKKYILIGDMMLASDVLPVEQVEWEKVLTNKEKADMVKHWEESYLNIIGK